MEYKDKAEELFELETSRLIQRCLNLSLKTIRFKTIYESLKASLVPNAFVDKKAFDRCFATKKDYITKSFKSNNIEVCDEFPNVVHSPLDKGYASGDDISYPWEDPDFDISDTELDLGYQDDIDEQ